jgi:hypothetical protein
MTHPQHLQLHCTFNLNNPTPPQSLVNPLSMLQLSPPAAVQLLIGSHKKSIFPLAPAPFIKIYYNFYYSSLIGQFRHTAAAAAATAAILATPTLHNNRIWSRDHKHEIEGFIGNCTT